MRYVPLVWPIVLALVSVFGCSPVGPGDPPPEPRFAPGEYGGKPLGGMETFINVKPSPSGDHIALVRKRTPGHPEDPRNQLWVVNQDGSDPQFIGANLGTVDWSSDGSRLAVTRVLGLDVYVYTIDLVDGDYQQWTGKEEQTLSFPTVSNPMWFSDDMQLLVTVAQRAYQQPFERGIYIINTQNGEVRGPLIKFFQSVSLGNGDRYAIGQKYVEGAPPLDGNYAKYVFRTNEWEWVTRFPKDSLYLLDGAPVPNPERDLLVQSRRVGHAKQLFLMNSDGENVRQITKWGGTNPRWSEDGEYFIFRRDVHKGEGARYVPFRYELSTGEAKPLWPSLPDSVPQFPDLSTQSSRLRLLPATR